MDIRQLRYFIAIAEEGSLSAASQRLNVAQPSLSQHVIKLEDELGLPLLARSSRGIALTEEGQLLLTHARGIMAAMERCLAEMREAGGQVRGQVAFGLPPSVSMVLSVPLAETVRLELPDVRLQAVEAMSGYIKTWLEEGRVDLAFLYDLDRVKDYEVTHFLDEELFFYSAPDAWPAGLTPGAPVPMAALAGLDLVLPTPSHGLRKLIEAEARARGIRLNVVIEMDAMTQIKELVARGSGYTIFAPAAAQDFVARGELVKARIVEPVMARPVYLVRNPARPPSRAARAVEAVCRDVARELIRRGIWEGRIAPGLA
ncbi:LysR family transcriptional regulator [bacterium]|nr:LysR family transcriptional regulator [bacterium]